MLLAFSTVFAEPGYWDGRLWRTFGESQHISGLTVDASGRLVLAGVSPGVCSFTNFSDVARWDGVRWEPLPKAPEASRILSLVTWGNDLWVGLRGAGLRRWTQGSWQTTELLAPATVGALAVNGSKLFVCGVFSNIGGLQITNAACWDGTQWQAWGTNAPACQLGNLTIVGEDAYLMVESSVGARRDCWQLRDGEWRVLSREVGSQGAVIMSTHNPEPKRAPARQALAGPTGSTITWWGGRLLAAGFPQAGQIFQWNGAGWEIWPTGGALVNPIGFAQQGGMLLVHGLIETVSGGVTNQSVVARFDGSRWEHLLGPEAMPVRSLSVHADELFAVGSHTNRNLYRQGTTILWHYGDRRWSVLNGGLNGVSSVGTGGNDVVSLPDGHFATVIKGDGTRTEVTLWKDGAWTLVPLDGGQAGQSLRATGKLAVQGKRLIGTATWQGLPAPSPASTNVLFDVRDGIGRILSLPHPLTVSDLAADESRVFVAGTDRRDGTGRSAIWCWNEGVWKEVELAFPDGTPLSAAAVRDVAVWKQRLVIAAQSRPDAETTNHWCLAWDERGTASLGKFDNQVLALHAAGERLFAGGAFESANGLPCPRVAERVGEAWVAIGGGFPRGRVSALAVSGDGRIAAAGSSHLGIARGLAVWRDGIWRSDLDSIADGGQASRLAWFGNDLAVTGSFANLGIESIGFAVWHDAGLSLHARRNAGGWELQPTGARSVRITVEESHDLSRWSRIGGPTLGGRLTQPAGLPAETDPRFWRVVELP